MKPEERIANITDLDFINMCMPGIHQHQRKWSSCSNLKVSELIPWMMFTGYC